MIKFRCGHCNQKIGVQDEFAGRRVRCPNCRQPAPVPESEHEFDEVDAAVADAGSASPAPTPAGPAQWAGNAARRSSPAPTDSWIEQINTAAIVWSAAGALALGAIVAAIFGSFITALFLFITTFALINGFLLGASRIAAFFAGTFVAMLVAIPLGRAVESPIGSVFGASGLTARVLSITMVAVVVLLVATAVGQNIIKRLTRDRPTIQRYDMLAGAALGGFEGALLSFMLMWVIFAIEPLANMSVAVSQGKRPNPVSAAVVDGATTIRESALGRAAEAVNPLDELHMVKLFQDSLIVLNDPDARRRFLNSPEIQQIQQRQSVQQAVEMLRDDEAIRAVIESDSGISGADLRLIMNSPTLLRVIDETGVVADLRPIVDDLEQAMRRAVEQTERNATEE